MQDAAGGGCLDDLLHHQRKKERHRDLVDDEGKRVCGGVITLGRGIRPKKRDDCPERQQQEMLARERPEPSHLILRTLAAAESRPNRPTRPGGTSPRSTAPTRSLRAA